MSTSAQSNETKESRCEVCGLGFSSKTELFDHTFTWEHRVKADSTTQEGNQQQNLPSESNSPSSISQLTLTGSADQKRRQVLTLNSKRKQGADQCHSTLRDTLSHHHTRTHSPPHEFLQARFSRGTRYFHHGDKPVATYRSPYCVPYCRTATFLKTVHPHLSTSSFAEQSGIDFCQDSIIPFNASSPGERLTMSNTHPFPLPPKGKNGSIHNNNERSKSNREHHISSHRRPSSSYKSPSPMSESIHYAPSSRSSRIPIVPAASWKTAHFSKQYSASSDTSSRSARMSHNNIKLKHSSVPRHNVVRHSHQQGLAGRNIPSAKSSSNNPANASELPLPDSSGSNKESLERIKTGSTKRKASSFRKVVIVPDTPTLLPPEKPPAQKASALQLAHSEHGGSGYSDVRACSSAEGNKQSRSLQSVASLDKERPLVKKPRKMSDSSVPHKVSPSSPQDVTAFTHKHIPELSKDVSRDRARALGSSSDIDVGSVPHQNTSLESTQSNSFRNSLTTTDLDVSRYVVTDAWPSTPSVSLSTSVPDSPSQSSHSLKPSTSVSQASNASSPMFITGKSVEVARTVNSSTDVSSRSVHGKSSTETATSHNAPEVLRTARSSPKVKRAKKRLPAIPLIGTDLNTNPSIDSLQYSPRRVPTLPPRSIPTADVNKSALIAQSELASSAMTSAQSVCISTAADVPHRSSNATIFASAHGNLTAQALSLQALKYLTKNVFSSASKSLVKPSTSLTSQSAFTSNPIFLELLSPDSLKLLSGISSPVSLAGRGSQVRRSGTGAVTTLAGTHVSIQTAVSHSPRPVPSPLKTVATLPSVNKSLSPVHSVSDTSNAVSQSPEDSKKHRENFEARVKEEPEEEAMDSISMPTCSTNEEVPSSRTCSTIISSMLHSVSVSTPVTVTPLSHTHPSPPSQSVTTLCDSRHKPILFGDIRHLDPLPSFIRDALHANDVARDLAQSEPEAPPLEQPNNSVPLSSQSNLRETTRHRDQADVQVCSSHLPSKPQAIVESPRSSALGSVSSEPPHSTSKEGSTSIRKRPLEGDDGPTVTKKRKCHEAGSSKGDSSATAVHNLTGPNVVGEMDALNAQEKKIQQELFTLRETLKEVVHLEDQQYAQCDALQHERDSTMKTCEEQRELDSALAVVSDKERLISETQQELKATQSRKMELAQKERNLSQGYRDVLKQKQDLLFLPLDYTTDSSHSTDSTPQLSTPASTGATKTVSDSTLPQSPQHEPTSPDIAPSSFVATPGSSTASSTENRAQLNLDMALSSVTVPQPPHSLSLGSPSLANSTCSTHSPTPCEIATSSVESASLGHQTPTSVLQPRAPNASSVTESAPDTSSVVSRPTCSPTTNATTVLTLAPSPTTAQQQVVAGSRTPTSSDATSLLKCSASSESDIQQLVGGSGPGMVYAPHSKEVLCLKACGDYLFSGSSDHSVHVYNVNSGELVITLPSYHKRAINSIAVYERENDVMFVTGSSDKHVHMHSVKKRKKVAVFIVGEPVMSIAVAGDALFIGLKAGGVQVVDLSTKKGLVSVQRCHQQQISHLHVHEHFLFIGSFDNTVSVWDISESIVNRSPFKHVESIPLPNTPLYIRIHNEHMFVGCGDCNVHIHSTKDWSRLRSLPHKKAVSGLDIAGNVLVTCSLDKLVRCYDIKTFELLQVYAGYEEMIFCVCVTKGKIIAGLNNGCLKAVNLDLTKVYSCKWLNCGLRFGIHHHLTNYHLQDHVDADLKLPTVCRWDNCSRTLNPSELLAHLKEHCRD